MSTTVERLCMAALQAENGRYSDPATYEPIVRGILAALREPDATQLAAVLAARIEIPTDTGAPITLGLAQAVQCWRAMIETE